MSTILTNEEKAAIVSQHIKNIEYSIYNLEVSIIEEEEDLDAEKETLFHQQMARIYPTYDFDTFRAYIAKLNRLIRANMPFITMTFRITEIKISIILANSFLPKCIKEAVFDSTLSKTAVVVQYTIV